MSSKNKNRFLRRSRRPFNREELFPKKEKVEIAVKNFLLHREFPDPVERKEYIRALIKGLETEPYLEN